MPHSGPKPALSQQLCTHFKPGGHCRSFVHGSAAEHARGATQKQQSFVVTKQKQLALASHAGSPLQTAQAAPPDVTALRRQIVVTALASAVALSTVGTAHDRRPRGPRP